MCKGKKIFALLLVVVMTMCMVFAGCTPQDENPTDATNDTIVTEAPEVDGPETEGNDETESPDATDAVEDGSVEGEADATEGETVEGETEAPADEATEGTDAE